MHEPRRLLTDFGTPLSILFPTAYRLLSTLYFLWKDPSYRRDDKAHCPASDVEGAFLATDESLPPQGIRTQDARATTLTYRLWNTAFHSIPYRLPTTFYFVLPTERSLLSSG
ncbi:hypothetical protein [Psychroflexus sediminis]|uniref:hypothetical protein n=1 Tax=Psychroflexus sediminis TaxID=470826 RepID=UPI00115FDE18|nr:hypothetical protein [Psychroflexus sediminis]